MLIITLIRIAITLTFLILAAGGPYAIIILRRFIRRYTVAHEALKSDHKKLKTDYDALKTRVEALEQAHGDHQ